MTTGGDLSQHRDHAQGPRTPRGIPVDPNLRIMAMSTLVNTFGNGALMTTFALYFTRVVGLRPTQVGLALSAGALAGLLVQVPAGHVADVRGPRRVFQILTFGAGFAMLGLLFARSVWALVAVMALIEVFDRGAGAVRNGYVARLAEGGQGVQFKAYLRAMTNVGISLGAMLGGLALWVDQGWAYLAVFVLDAATCIVTAIWLGRLPHIAPAPARQRGEPRMAVLRDLPFVVVTVLSGVASMHFVVIELALPLWIALYTSAPKSLVAITLMINTVCVALLQVRLTRNIDRVGPSARAMARSGFWIAGGFALIAFASSAGVAGDRPSVCRQLGARGRGDDQLRRAVGCAAGSGSAGASGTVPRLRRHGILAAADDRTHTHHVAVHRMGATRLVRPGCGDRPGQRSDGAGRRLGPAQPRTLRSAHPHRLTRPGP